MTTNWFRESSNLCQKSSLYGTILSFVVEHQGTASYRTREKAVLFPNGELVALEDSKVPVRTENDTMQSNLRYQ